MNKIVGFLLLCCTFFACSKADMGGNMPHFSEGTYSGTFQRQNLTSSAGSAITLNFSAGNWHGSSTINKYPALCEGTYMMTSSTISFVNTCTWAPDFDWSLILEGTYEMTSYGDTIVLSKQQNMNTIDIYKLKRM
ncbi:hypothetical protein DBR32_02820 [Taibaiella sp. KBW10]|uniref:hypothetical protein n=1 Tax=Taibaiella sp. KBW10 TaxID=2153357 RepID=UPI000F591350|nr:hypothetical protein [Taibaiella sp. KBW10]RQO32548.1 hypothetical protein DBR32_02820 [Taibaiella sp. KBW10]